MSLRFAPAIVLAVLALFLFVIARSAWYRWKKRIPRKVRRRDLAPKHLQERRKVMASLRRVLRGLRFPTVREKQEHKQFITKLAEGKVRLSSPGVPCAA